MNYSSLLIDQYQLVMAYSYWTVGMADQQAVFHLSFRKLPLRSPYIIAAGLQNVIDFIKGFKFNDSDLVYLSQVPGQKGPLFSKEFIDYLSTITLACDIDAIPEGRLIFAKEPVLRITGPILQCQLLETALINFVHFSSLIATKASQIYLAAKGDPVIEFGLRRAQGPDGGITASRSAYLGGCYGTSNVLAGKLFSIPIHGTQAHSWIMAFPTEIEAFRSFAQVMKSNTSLLVDTYETIQGIHNAVKVALVLKQNGYHLAAIRLDSGDLLELSKQARQILDQAGLNDTQIMASGDLDEHLISQLKEQHAPIDSWGVGTRLVTSYDEPALNAIYKLSAIQAKNGQWQNKMKLSNDPNKTTLPGVHQVTRFYKDDQPIQDVIWDLHIGEEEAIRLNFDRSENLLRPIFKGGKCVYQPPSLKEIRKHVILQIENFKKRSTRDYPVVIGPKMQNMVNALTKKLKA
jgi:nicotinate phosphoribosyltransferase